MKDFFNSIESKTLERIYKKILWYVLAPQVPELAPQQAALVDAVQAAVPAPASSTISSRITSFGIRTISINSTSSGSSTRPTNMCVLPCGAGMLRICTLWASHCLPNLCFKSIESRQ